MTAVCSVQVWCSAGGEGVQHMARQGGLGVAGDGARGGTREGRREGGGDGGRQVAGNIRRTRRDIT